MGRITIGSGDGYDGYWFEALYRLALSNTKVVFPTFGASDALDYGIP